MGLSILQLLTFLLNKKKNSNLSIEHNEHHISKGSCDSSQRRVTVSGHKAINSETWDSLNLAALIGKDPDVGKDWRWKEKGTTEDETVGWLHWLNGHEFEQALRVGDGQGSLACCSPCNMCKECKESDITEQLNWTDRIKGFRGVWSDGKVNLESWEWMEGKVNSVQLRKLRVIQMNLEFWPTQ